MDLKRKQGFSAITIMLTTTKTTTTSSKTQHTRGQFPKSMCILVVHTYYYQLYMKVFFLLKLSNNRKVIVSYGILTTTELERFFYIKEICEHFKIYRSKRFLWLDLKRKLEVRSFSAHSQYSHDCVIQILNSLYCLTTCCTLSACDVNLSSSVNRTN